MQLAHPRSPLHKFAFGTKESLSKPEAKQAMIDFYDSYYSPNLMSLCVSSNMPLAQLEKLVKAKFGAIKGKNVSLPDVSNPKPYDTCSCKRLVKMVPVNDLDELKITWSLPFYGDDEDDDETSPNMNIKYYMELFGHEGTNSVLSYLKSQGWATGLETRRKSMCGCMTKFDVNIELTKDGVANYVKVVEAVFAYAQLLDKAGPQEWFANELNAAGELRF